MKDIYLKIVGICIFIAIIAMYIMIGPSMETDVDRDSGFVVEVYYRGFDVFGNDQVSEWIRLHSIFKDENNVFYELKKVDGNIEIFIGDLTNMSNITQDYMSRNPEPDELHIVDPDLFHKAVLDFKKLNRGKGYSFMYFSENCVGLRDYALGISEIKK